MRFSKIEINHLFISWVVISLAFAIVFTENLFSFNFIVSIMISGIIVGTAFILHELAHKFMAQKYGCFAEFRANKSMLILALVISFFGFVFAAPGAVIIQGHITKREYGIVSAAGVVVNIILSLFFLLIKISFPEGIISLTAYYGFIVNAWIALFNLLPFGPLDGKKILHWSKKWYAILIITAAFLMFLSQIGF